MRKHTYYKLIRVDYEDSEYLRITNTDTVAGNFTIRIVNGTPNFEYSIDGVNWTSVSSTTTVEGIVPNGNIYFRGINSNFMQYLSMDTLHTVSGNALSLLDYNNMSTITSIPNNGFYHLFKDDTKLVSAKDMNFGNVTSIGSQGCYSMFSGCTALTTAPDLSSVTSIGSQGCYSMFSGCTALTTAPDISNVTSIGDSGCSSMFQGCTALTTAPDLSSVTTIGTQGCYYMFYNCYVLQTIYTPSVSTWNTSIFGSWVNNAGYSASTPRIMYTTETLKDLIPNGSNGHGNYTVTVK